MGLEKVRDEVLQRASREADKIRMKAEEEAENFQAGRAHGKRYYGSQGRGNIQAA